MEFFFLCCKNLIDITYLWSRKNRNDGLKKGVDCQYDT